MPGPRPVRAGDPQWIGEYLVTARLGEGGQGIVYLCTSGPRKVAVKLLHRRFSGTEEGRRLFAREIEAAGRVHGYTADVLASGEQGGRPFIVSEYIAGESVQSRVDDQGPYRGNDLLALASGTASALTAIHDAGLVHCDFKPANILVSADGPRVIDFGVVRALDTIALRDHELRGTPAYMAPEQITGGPVGQHTDVFAWGSTMVFASTGVPPFGDDHDNGVLLRITNDAPALDDVPPTLRRIIEACLSEDPAKRPSARDLTTLLRPRIPPQKPRAPTTLAGHTRPITSIATNARIAVTGSQDLTARVWDLTTDRQLGAPLKHDSPVLSVACASDVLLTGCQDHTINLWDLTTGDRLGDPLHGHRGPVLSLTVHGRTAISISNDRTLQWDLTTSRSKLLLHNNHVMSAACCELGAQTVAVTGGAWDQALRIVDLATLRFVGPPLTGHTNKVTSIACGDLDGKPIALTGSYDRTARVWDLTARREIASVPHLSAVTAVTFGTHQGSPLLITAAADRYIRVFDLVTRQELSDPLTAGTTSANRAFPLTYLDHDGPTILTSGDDNTLQSFHPDL
ncbi:serine/threonine-protein kinase [Spirillospora sp. NPDC047279]|uniref:serine/threonine-protein kinase n=1 Tax=Spirillospora sp. NPDC047279 TaxID=3155478 RepID=UPI0033F27128